MKDQEVPVGFGMALMKNESAMNAFAMMTGENKQAIWAKARHVRSRQEMEQLVGTIGIN